MNQKSSLRETLQSVSQALTANMQDGERHKIRLANLAIAAFQKTSATERGDALAAAGYN